MVYRNNLKVADLQHFLQKMLRSCYFSPAEKQQKHFFMELLAVGIPFGMMNSRREISITVKKFVTIGWGWAIL